MLAALICNLSAGPSAASRYWYRVPKQALTQIVEKTAVADKAVRKVWERVKSAPEIEPRLREAATVVDLEINELIQRARVMEMLRAIEQEIDDEEILIVLM